MSSVKRFLLPFLFAASGIAVAVVVLWRPRTAPANAARSASAPAVSAMPVSSAASSVPEADSVPPVGFPIVAEPAHLRPGAWADYRVEGIGAGSTVRLFVRGTGKDRVSLDLETRMPGISEPVVTMQFDVADATGTQPVRVLRATIKGARGGPTEVTDPQLLKTAFDRAPIGRKDGTRSTEAGVFSVFYNESRFGRWTRRSWTNPVAGPVGVVAMEFAPEEKLASGATTVRLTLVAQGNASATKP